MAEQITIISGNIHVDDRGSIKFVNDFGMTAIKRFYIIENADTNVIRGWRGHRTEQRWFYSIDGSFEIKLVCIDNWQSPDRGLPKTSLQLTGKEQSVLHIPAGYASAFKALEPKSRLMVFADYGIEHSVEDDYLFPVDYFGF